MRHEPPGLAAAPVQPSGTRTQDPGDAAGGGGRVRLAAPEGRSLDKRTTVPLKSMGGGASDVAPMGGSGPLTVLCSMLAKLKFGYAAR